MGLEEAHQASNLPHLVFALGERIIKASLKEIVAEEAGVILNS
jgi:hypothetical protein